MYIVCTMYFFVGDCRPIIYYVRTEAHYSYTSFVSHSDGDIVSYAGEALLLLVIDGAVCYAVRRISVGALRET